MKTAKYPHNRVLFTLVALLSVVNGSLQGFLGPRTLILPRSQSVNAARDLVGWQQQLHRHDETGNYWLLAFTPEYTHTFAQNHLTDQVFGASCFKVTGSAVEDRQSTDLLADYFELPRDYQGRLSISPLISQFIADFNFYVGLDRICPGLFFIIHFPVVSSKWDIRLEECVIDPGTDFHPAGYFSDERIDRKDLLFDMREYLRGHRTIGDVKEPLCYQKVIGLTGRNVANRLSDVQGALGYDLVSRDRGHFGIELRASAPAGNRPQQRYLFDAVVGNGHHWELGGGLTSHCRIWENDRHQFLVYLDANITHLFSSDSQRSFNLIGRCAGSRYMMLEEIAQGSLDLFVYGDYPSTDQYTHRLVPAINITTLDVRTSFAVQGDVVLKFALTRDNFCFDIGYDFWARSHEKLSCRSGFEQNRYALKGDAQVYGFDVDNSYNEQAIPLSASQHMATIFAGQGTGNFEPGLEFANANADNPTEAFGPNGVLMQLNSADAAALYLAQEPVQTSQPSIFLSECDLDIASGLVPTSLTSKIFTHAGYTWYSDTCNPFLGIGGEVEWAHGSCDRGGISQWGIWCKMGLSY